MCPFEAADAVAFGAFQLLEMACCNQWVVGKGHGFRTFEIGKTVLNGLESSHDAENTTVVLQR